MSHDSSRAVVLSLMLVLSVVAGSVAFSGAAAAATSVSISPDDAAANATDVTYTASGNVELANQDTLQHVDADLGPANVSDVGADDVRLYVDGNEYTDGFSQFDASNGLVEFKLSNSRSLSDGDPVRVVVANVTNPDDDFTANVTLHDTAGDRWQSLDDTVDIATEPNVVYDDLALNDTSVNVGEDVRVTATVENTGEQSGSYNATLLVDGTALTHNEGTLDGGASTTTSFVTDFDSTGAYDVRVESLGPTDVTVSEGLVITGGSASPTGVTSGKTVSNQQVTVDLTGLSQDGDTDTHYVEFPNPLASSLSVNSAESSVTSVTSSPNVVDGSDGDGVQDTVRFATSGDGGGSVDTTLTVDVSVTYPSPGTYHIDARTVDSDGDTATQQSVAAVLASAPDEDTTSDAGNNGVVPYSGDEEPTVTGFNLTADGGDVDAVVKTTTAVDTLRVSVSGPVETTLVREDFTVGERDETYTHTADIATDVSGTFEATVESVGAGGEPTSLDETDRLTVGLPGTSGASAVATPPWTEASESVHTFSVTVPENSSIEGETLQSVAVGYSDAFRDESGSVSSVSDDQNVATLTVVGADGTVESRMGGTDAVTVNTNDDTVSLNLADVDSSRVPTLDAGDRLLLQIRPVTNAEDAGEYETTLTLGTADGASATTDLPLRITTEASTDAFASTVVTPDDEAVSLDLTRSPDIGTVTIASEGAATGTVSVTVPQDHPAATDALSEDLVAAITITRPAPVADDPATITTSLSRDAFVGSADALTVSRYDAAADEWVALDTTVVDTRANTVTVRATTNGTSLFAITSSGETPANTAAADQQPSTVAPSAEPTIEPMAASTSEPTTTTQPTATSEPTGTETESSGPGFGATLALVAFLSAALVLSRRD